MLRKELTYDPNRPQGYDVTMHHRELTANMARLAAAAELEVQHVHNVYSQIASHFSDTRYKPWPRVVQFLQQRLPAGSLVADVGAISILAK